MRNIVSSEPRRGRRRRRRNQIPSSLLLYTLRAMAFLSSSPLFCCYHVAATGNHPHTALSPFTRLCDMCKPSTSLLQTETSLSLSFSPVQYPGGRLFLTIPEARAFAFSWHWSTVVVLVYIRLVIIVLLFPQETWLSSYRSLYAITFVASSTNSWE